MSIVLSYFDIRFGPVIFFSAPESVPEGVKGKILDFMNISTKDDVFEVKMKEEKLKIINKLFHIPSQWTRGTVEQLMFTIIVDKNYRSDMFDILIEETVNEIKSNDNMYKAFYIQDDRREDHTAIDAKYEELIEILGNCFEKLNNLLKNPDMGVFIVLGISKVGKTSILERLKQNIFNVNVKPTLITNILNVMVDNYMFRTIDVSGQKRLRDDWWTYTKHPDAIIYVIDISDTSERHIESKLELERILAHFAENSEFILSPDIPVLFCINKMDLVEDLKILDAMNEFFAFTPDYINHKVQFTSAKTGEGISEAFTWLFQELLKIT